MIRVTDLSVHVGEFHLEKVSLEVPTGGYGVLMGPTGSGKTTLLEALAGLKPVSHGQVELDHREVTRLKPAERNLGYVPQDGALFSTMSVRRQLGFALAVRRVPRPQVEHRVEELAELLKIGDLLDRSTVGLSGGERQRVALGRALSFRPATLLLDEPLSALDDDTRVQMYALLKEIRRQTGVTALHVTHSFEETAHLADCLYRLEAGQVVRRRISAARSPGGNGAARESDSDESRSDVEIPR